MHVADEIRISEVRANQLLEVWKRIQVQHETKRGSDNRLLSTVSETDIDRMKEHLFIETGEDTVDTFQAFKYYKLFTEITDKDRERY